MFLYAILGISLLMIVHESGHYFVARAFKMRVEKFAIGIGPTIWRHQPKDSDTIFQVGLIPFMAYVQIAGQNPYEDSDEDDPSNFNNGSLFGRIATIIAGPLANYLFASVVFFAAALVGVNSINTASTMIEVVPDRPAAHAGLKDGDQILAIDGTKVSKWKDIPPLIQDKPGTPIRLSLKRGDQTIELVATPEERDGRGMLGVSTIFLPMSVSEAGNYAVQLPASLVMMNIYSIGRMISGKEKAQLSGPLGIMRETEKAAKAGLASYLSVIGFLSTAVGFFNMLPFPALDGGRLMFLGYEGVTRHRPNQAVETRVHTIGMILLLTTLVFVTYREWGDKKAPSDLAADRYKKEAADKKDAAGKKQNNESNGKDEKDSSASSGKPDDK